MPGAPHRCLGISSFASILSGRLAILSKGHHRLVRFTELPNTFTGIIRNQEILCRFQGQSQARLDCVENGKPELPSDAFNEEIAKHKENGGGDLSQLLGQRGSERGSEGY